MNEKYVAVALYHTIIKHQFRLLIDALEELSEYDPTMHEVTALMKEVEHEIELAGRQLLKSIEKGEDNDAN